MSETIDMKLEDQIRDTMRFKHLSFKTEESYVGWYRRYVLWHGKKHPSEMGAAEVEAFLTHLAVDRKLAAASQNQALNALVFDSHAASGVSRPAGCLAAVCLAPALRRSAPESQLIRGPAQRHPAEASCQ